MIHRPIDVRAFEKALREEGMVGATVQQVREPSGEISVLRVEQTVHGERVSIEHQVAPDGWAAVDNPSKRMAVLARETASEMRTISNEEHCWGDKAVRFDFSGECKATCLNCAAVVELREIQQTSSPMAETAVPNPNTVDFSSLS